MPWKVAVRSDYAEIAGFLRRNEWAHVGLSSRLIEYGGGALPPRSAAVLYLNRRLGEGIAEVVLSTSNGLVIPALERVAGPCPPRDDVGALLEGRATQIHSIMGLRRHVAPVQHSLAADARTVVDYDLMVLERIDSPRPALPTALDIRRSRPRDAAALYPLQKAYEMEEVLLDPARFSPKASMSHLQRNLRKEIVYHAHEAGRVVAKAGTNAIGFECAQLGGVYTVPDRRNRGYAEAVLRALSGELLGRFRTICLFVKKNNAAARRLYEKLGFRSADEFRIAYY